MVEIELKITNPTGLHTRPGTLFTKKAKEFSSDITVNCREKEANGKSIVKVLKLGISQGDTIRIVAEGSDEQYALDSLKALIDQLES